MVFATQDNMENKHHDPFNVRAYPAAQCKWFASSLVELRASIHPH
jgi:hypothetical protein